MFTEADLNKAITARQQEGYKAASNFKAVNPYVEGTLNADCWFQGWQHGCQAIEQRHAEHRVFLAAKAKRKAAKALRTKANRLARGQEQSRKARGK